MKKTSLGIIIAFLLSTLGLSGAAMASDVGDHELPSWHVELLLKPYQPKISKNAAKQDFYNLMYGESEPIMTTFATHHYLWDGFGLLGLGVSVGYWKTTGNTRICQDANENTIPCYGQPGDTDETRAAQTALVAASTEGNSSTQLMVVPVSLEVVYRIDYLNREWDIPLDAYAQFGLDYHLWWATTEGSIAETTSTNDDGTTETTKGKGATPGMNASVGLMLDLSFLEPVTASRGRNNGIAASYLFFEWNWSQGDGFSQPNRLDMSSSGWSLGLGMDFL